MKAKRSDDNDDDGAEKEQSPYCHDQLPSIEEAKVSAASNTEKGDPSSYNNYRRRAAVLLAIVTLVASLLLLLLAKGHSDSSLTTSPPEMARNSYNEQPSSFESRLQNIILDHTGGNKEEEPDESSLSFLHEPPGYQYMAFQRLVGQKHIYTMYSESRLKQVYGLLALYYATNIDDKDDNDSANGVRGSSSGSSWPNAVYWELGHDECQWEGILCDSENNNVMEIDLTNFGLNGVIPSELALVESVKRIRLDNNPGLQGEVPATFGRMNNLGE